MDCVKKGTTFGNRTTLLITPPPIEDERLAIEDVDAKDEGEEDEDSEEGEDEFTDDSDEVYFRKLISSNFCQPKVFEFRLSFFE